jgi:hypothetical protein
MGEKGNVAAVVGVESDLASQALDAATGVAKDAASGAVADEGRERLKGATARRKERKQGSADDTTA